MYAFITGDSNYHIKVHGNGWAYTVTDRSTGEHLWVQDHDADQLQKDTADFDDTSVLAAYFEALCCEEF
jgi:hypothetical protein